MGEVRVDLPKALLEAVDRRAVSLKNSRNRLIVKALERELSASSEWSSGFFEELERADAETKAAFDTLLSEVRARRSSKGPSRL